MAGAHFIQTYLSSSCHQVDRRTGKPGTLIFCRTTQQSFLRLLTTAAVLAPYGNPPLTNSGAWSAYERLRGAPRIAFETEPAHLEREWKRLALRGTASPKTWMDAYLSAFALAGGHQLVTTDKGFIRYEGLDLHIL